MTRPTIDPGVRIPELLAAFRLPTIAEEFVPRLRQAGLESVLPLLCEIFELEAGDRRERRTARLLKAAHLPPGKTFDTLDDKRLPAPLVQKLRELARGDFLDHAINVLAFGLPGVGKSHAAMSAATSDAITRDQPSTSQSRPCTGRESGPSTCCSDCERRRPDGVMHTSKPGEAV